MLLRPTLIKLLFLVLIISACSKRTVDLEAISHDVKLNTSLESSSNVKVKTASFSNNYLFSDEQSDFQIVIKPKGLFKINSIGGFEGEAESITINGKATKTEAAGQTVSGIKDSTVATDLKLKSKSQEKDKIKIKNTVAESPGLISTIVVFLIIGMLIWGYKFYRKN